MLCSAARLQLRRKDFLSLLHAYVRPFFLLLLPSRMVFPVLLSCCRLPPAVLFSLLLLPWDF